MKHPLFLISLMIFSLVFPCHGEDRTPFSLRVESLERGKVILDFPVRSGDRFYLHYIHSSDQTPIYDIFEIGGSGEMILIEENFNWYGAGLEFMNWEKAFITIGDGKIKVHLKRHLPSLHLRVGRVANHTIIFNGVAISLKDIARGGELLKIWVRPRDQS